MDPGTTISEPLEQLFMLRLEVQIPGPIPQANKSETLEVR